MANFYQLLNLLPTATPTEIQAAYAKERAKLFTDTSAESSDDNPTSHLQLLDEAYATLADAGRRAAYDRSLGMSAGTSIVIAAQPNAIVVPQAPSGPLLQQACPHCGALNPTQATLCGQCKQQMARPCPNCGQNVILGQTVCPRCNTIIPEYDQRKFAEGLIVDKRVQDSRLASDTRAETLETIHRTRAIQGLVFWLVVGLSCVGITAATLFAFYYFAQTNVR